jgi:hypothetical protein
MSTLDVGWAVDELALFLDLAGKYGIAYRRAGTMHFTPH